MVKYLVYLQTKKTVAASSTHIFFCNTFAIKSVFNTVSDKNNSKAQVSNEIFIS